MSRSRRPSSTWIRYVLSLWFDLIAVSPPSHQPPCYTPWLTSTQVDMLLTATTVLSVLLHIIVETHLVLPRDASTSTSRPAFLFLSSTLASTGFFSLLILCAFFHWRGWKQQQQQPHVHVTNVKLKPVVGNVTMLKPAVQNASRRYTYAEVSTHNNSTPNDTWLIIAGRVYSVGAWASQHPGGDMIIRAMAGKDATDPFLVMHPQWVTERLLPRFEIGVLDTYEPTPLQQDFRSILTELQSRGFFKTSLTYYFFKVCWQAILLFITISLIMYGYYIMSAIMLGFFWQQLAFLGHDFGHNSVFGSKEGDWFGSMLVTSFFGVSGAWWKGNHNLHHVVTNSIDYDPDIQHLPVMAITEKIFPGVKSFYYNYHFEMDRFARWMVSHQHFLYYPVLMGIARYNLYVQSLMLVCNKNYNVYGRKGEIIALMAFWSMYLTLMSYLPTWSTIIVYNLVAHAICGFIHVQITLSHFAMDTYMGPGYEQHHPEHFIRTQFGTTMDVDCSCWMDWFHGGLQFQTVHHLYPRIPRHRLRQIRDEYILPLCEKYGITYHCYEGHEAHHKVYVALRRTAFAARTYDYKPSDNKLSDMLNVQG